MINLRYRQLSCGLALLLLAACGHATVETTSIYQGASLPRPQLVLVRDFVATPTDVALDSGRLARLRRLVSGSSDNQQEAAAAQAVVDALSNGLVADIEKMGLAAKRIPADAAIPPEVTAALVDGNVLSIDEGNRAKRVVVGFGAGASKVEASVALSYLSAGTDARELARFHASGNSGYAPGMLATGGAGAAAGAATSVAVSGGTQVIRESNGTTVSADAQGISEKIAAQLREIFVKQGWVAAN